MPRIRVKSAMDTKSLDSCDFDEDASSTMNEEHRAWQKAKNSMDGHDDLRQWVSLISEFSSIHGYVWYSRFSNRGLRMMTFLFVFVVTFGLPVFLSVELISFVNDDKLSNAVEWNTAKKIKYPELTICNSRYFDSYKLQEYGIENDFANYLSMALDPTSGTVVKLMSTFNPAYITLMESYKSRLDQILQDKNMDYMEFMEEIAIKCEDFIVFCEVHKTFFYTDLGPNNTCCSQIFDNKPFFGFQGTCYRTKKDKTVVETVPYIYNSVKLWMLMKEEMHPKYKVDFKGSDAAERTGVNFAISKNDEPSTVLGKKPLRAPRGQVTTVGLSVIEVDRSELNEKFCEKEGVDEFEAKYDIPYTKMNCEIFTIASKFTTNCSTLKYARMEPGSPLPPCKPHEVIEALEAKVQSSDSTSGSGADDAVEMAEESETDCKHECKKVEYVANIRTSVVDEFAVGNYSAFAAENHTAQDFAIVQFYFETFEYQKHVLLQQTFLDFLSKVGGWFGLFVGASIISFCEIFYFVFLLCRGFCKMCTTRRSSAGRGSRSNAHSSRSMILQETKY